MDIGDSSPKVISISDGSVEIVFRPECSFPVQEKVDLAGGAPFPTADDFSQAVMLSLSNENMDMVRHYTPGDELVLRAVAFDEGILGELCDFGHVEIATAVPGIFVARDATGDFLMVFFVG